ncbi:MAG: 4-(cytidine 5'-diphospho)-2-C-methyl-D-erythritol kinase [Fimbriiglobus sp.]
MLADLTHDCTLVAGPDSLIGWAPAKVNLFLEVLSKRPDGFHEVETLIVAVNLYDTLTASRSPALTLTCSEPSIPTGPTNLVLKAALALQTATRTAHGAKLHLTKRIPHEAGMGGGSSDAALSLVMLNRLWKLNLPTETLVEIAGSIGSDVGAFLAGPAAWCSGRGEVVTPAELPFSLDLVVVKPPFGLSTAKVYQHHTPPTTRQDSQAIRNAQDLKTLATSLHNRLQAPAFAVEPRVATIHDELRNCAPQAVLLSGSGSAVFALASDAADARRIAHEYRSQSSTPDVQIYVVRTLKPRSPRPATPLGARS